MGENIHKCYQQGFNFQNIHTDHTTQYQKKKKLIKKLTKDLKRHLFLQGRHTDGQLACKMMLNIVNY